MQMFMTMITVGIIMITFIRYYIEGELGGAKIKPLVHIVETTM